MSASKKINKTAAQHKTLLRLIHSSPTSQRNGIPPSKQSAPPPSPSVRTCCDSPSSDPGFLLSLYGRAAWMANRRQTVGVCDSVFFDLPPGRPIAARENYSCVLSRSDNSSAHFVAHKLYLRTASQFRCSGCGAPTSIPELWKALSALPYILPLTPFGTHPSKPGIYISRARSQTGSPVAVCFTIVDEAGNMERLGDGSEQFAPADAAWDHLMLDPDLAKEQAASTVAKSPNLGGG